ncbi:MAG: hypothetical protein EA383_02040 [Spirochaetaceae bacterium]|nr:MAG: hypothetical protein EA383_02040 [Spirochaetaceae bacterium]
MKKLVAVFGLAIMVLAACIDYEEELVIQADGSAEHRVAMAVSLEFSEMDGAMGGMNGSITSDFFDDFVGEGITVLSQDSFVRPTRNMYGDEELYQVQEIRVRYDNVAEAPNLAGDEDSFTFERRSDGSFLLRRRIEADGAEEPDPEMDEMLEFMGFLFADNGFSFALEMPARIRTARVEGAPEHLQPTWEGRRVEWYLPFVEMMGAKDDFWLVVETAAR